MAANTRTARQSGMTCIELLMLVGMAALAIVAVATLALDGESYGRRQRMMKDLMTVKSDMAALHALEHGRPTRSDAAQDMMLLAPGQALSMPAMDPALRRVLGSCAEAPGSSVESCANTLLGQMQTPQGFASLARDLGDGLESEPIPADSVPWSADLAALAELATALLGLGLVGWRALRAAVRRKEASEALRAPFLASSFEPAPAPDERGERPQAQGTTIRKNPS